MVWANRASWIIRKMKNQNDVAHDDYYDDYNIKIDDNNRIIIIIFRASSLALSLYRFDISSQLVYAALYKINLGGMNSY